MVDIVVIEWINTKSSEPSCGKVSLSKRAVGDAHVGEFRGLPALIDFIPRTRVLRIHYAGRTDDFGENRRVIAPSRPTDRQPCRRS